MLLDDKLSSARRFLLGGKSWPRSPEVDESATVALPNVDDALDDDNDDDDINNTSAL